MANTSYVFKTNHFRVTDENAYKKICNCIQNTFDISFEDIEEDGETYHFIGGYDCMNYESDSEDLDLDGFINDIQKILPDKEAFIYTEIYNEKLREVDGCTYVVTNNDVKFLSLNQWAEQNSPSSGD